VWFEDGVVKNPDTRVIRLGRAPFTWSPSRRPLRRPGWRW
jgi:hypothetical protein